MTSPAILARSGDVAAVHVDLTPRAAREVRALLARTERTAGFGLRIAPAPVRPADPADAADVADVADVADGGDGGDVADGGDAAQPEYLLSLSPAPRPGDTVLPRHGFDVFVATDGPGTLDGLRIDFVSSPQSSGFVIDRVRRPPMPRAPFDAAEPRPGPFDAAEPRPVPGPPELVAAVARALATVRPALQGDGGDLRLVAVDGATAWVALTGACSGCSSASVTLVQLIERAVTAAVPGIDRVEPVG